MARAISALAPPLVHTYREFAASKTPPMVCAVFCVFSVTYASITFGTARTAPRTDGNEPREFSATLAARRASKASRLSTLFPNTPSETLLIASHPGWTYKSGLAIRQGKRLARLLCMRMTGLYSPLRDCSGLGANILVAIRREGERSNWNNCSRKASASCLHCCGLGGISRDKINARNRVLHATRCICGVNLLRIV